MAKSGAHDMNTERLFNLLMPSSGAPGSIPYNAQPEPEEAPAAPETAKSDRLDALRERMAGTAAIPVLDGVPGGLVLVNLTEAMVAERLDAAFDKFNCCKCDSCKKRAAALALNALTPHYVAARVDEIETLLDACPTKDVSASIVRAVLHVKATPEH